MIDEAPILYKIYDGKVSKTMDFGAFVALEGVKGRREGLVHVSQLKVSHKAIFPAGGWELLDWGGGHLM